MAGSRELAVQILVEIEQGRKSHLAVADALEKHPAMPDVDRRLFRRLVRTTLEERILLDHRIGLKSSVPVVRMKPYIRNLLRMSACQLFFMDRIPPSAVVNEAVRLAGKAGFRPLTGFVNGVLRAIAREEHWPEMTEEEKTGIPAWILEKWKKEQGEDACHRMAAALKGPEKLSFCLQKGQGSEKELLDILREEGMEAEPAPFPEGAFILKNVKDLSASRAYREGRIRIQDLSSMLAGTLARPLPDSLVLDVCAAPGGKSLSAAEALQGSGQVIACDISRTKTRLIDENIRRSGFRNIESKVQDARTFVPEWEEAFDLVLADLPCSGLGVMGRKPEIRFVVSPEEILTLQKLQREILRNACRYVKPGGILVYSTCTITREENQENQAWIRENQEFLPVPLTDRLPEALQSEPGADEGWLQLLPGVHPCDGFFAAVFRKKRAEIYSPLE